MPVHLKKSKTNPVILPCGKKSLITFSLILVYFLYILLAFSVYVCMYVHIFVHILSAL